MTRPFVRLLAALAVAAVSWSAAAEPPETEAWQDILDLEFEGAEVVHDESFQLVVPDRVEEAFSVPVVVGFSDTPFAVTEIALFAENNPFPQVVRAWPRRPLQAMGLNIRLERSTPVRAAARDEAGVWHVVRRDVDVATPGGCSAGAVGGLPVGDIAMRQFVRPNGVSRLKVRIGHPMHTGLATDEATGAVIPARHLDRVVIDGDSGALAELRLWASVAGDPTLMFDFPETQRSVRVSATDTDEALFSLAARPSTIRRGWSWEDEFAVEPGPDAM